MVSIVPSSKFKKEVKHLSLFQREKLEKLILKILQNPQVGKPLKYSRGERSLRVKPYRIIYSYRRDIKTLYLLKFEHRKNVYD